MFEAYKVYISVSPEGRVLSVGNSGGDGKLKIDEGEGDKYHHAESQYFDLPVRNQNKTHNYRYDGGQIRKATDAELAAELAEIEANRPPVPPTPIEELQTENRLQKAQLMAQGDRQDFIEGCIAEMAMQLYA